MTSYWEMTGHLCQRRCLSCQVGLKCVTFVLLSIGVLCSCDSNSLTESWNDLETFRQHKLIGWLLLNWSTKMNLATFSEGLSSSIPTNQWLPQACGRRWGSDSKWTRRKKQLAQFRLRHHSRWLSIFPSLANKRTRLWHAWTPPPPFLAAKNVAVPSSEKSSPQQIFCLCNNRNYVVEFHSILFLFAFSTLPAQSKLPRKLSSHSTLFHKHSTAG